MMAGLYIWIIQGSSLLFVISIIAEMVLYFNVILSGINVESGKSKSWMTGSVVGFCLLGHDLCGGVIHGWTL